MSNGDKPSSTPRTDANLVAIPPGSWTRFDYVTADFARQLERELAEAKKANPIGNLCTHIKESLRFCGHGYIHITCGDCQRRD